MEAIEGEGFGDKDLANIAYTLQIGREAMEDRFGMIVISIKDMEEKLRGFVEGKEDIEDIYRGQVKRGKETLAIFGADEDLQKAIESWINKKKYGKLVELWVKGYEIDWGRLYGEARPRRISLPTYSFARERYWIPETDLKIIKENRETRSTSIQHTHPLLHRNTSDLGEQRFSSIFTGEEFFLRDHKVRGEKILAGVAYLEMARAAVEESAGADGETRIKLKNIVWGRPIVVNGSSKEVHIGIYPEEGGELSYEIYSEEGENEEEIVHSQGRAVIETVKEARDREVIDIEFVRAECNKREMGREECYGIFKGIGIEYGPRTSVYREHICRRREGTGKTNNTGNSERNSRKLHITSKYNGRSITGNNRTRNRRWE